MALKTIYVPMVMYEWGDGEPDNDGSDGCLYWYYSLEEARKYFPTEVIQAIETVFPEIWESN